jgi:tRNA (cytosine34-C5)-methyltransferase
MLCVAAQGSFVLVYDEEESPFSEQGIPPLALVMVGWQGAKSTRAYIPLSDCVHYLRLCGADVSKYGKCYSSCSKRGRICCMQ